MVDREGGAKKGSVLQGSGSGERGLAAYVQGPWPSRIPSFLKYLLTPSCSVSVSCPKAVVSVKPTSSAPPPMAPVTAASPAGTAPNATAPARLVIMEMAVRTSAHAAEIMNPVTPKLGNVGDVTLDGLESGVGLLFEACIRMPSLKLQGNLPDHLRDFHSLDPQTSIAMEN